MEPIMKAVLLSLILLFPGGLFATSYNSTQSGDFNTNSTWGGHGHPQSGDTWTIASGTTVICSGTCAAGLAAPTTCTVDGTVKSGGTLSVAAGATFTHSGELDVQHAGTINVNANAISGSGALALAPGTGAVCKLAFTNLGQGAPNLNLTGVAGTPGRNYYAILTCNTALHGGAACTATPEPGGTNANLNFNYFQVTGFGNATNLAFKTFAVNSVSIQNGLFDHDGNVRLLTGSCPTCNFVVQNVSFTNPTDTVSHYLVFDFYSAGTPTGGARSIQNVTAANRNQIQHYFANISIIGSQTGQSILAGDAVDMNGFIGYNVSLLQTTSNALSQIIRSSGVVVDMGGSASYCYELRNNATLKFQDSFCLDRVPNQHEILSTVPATGGAANLYQRYLCDGDGFYNSDTGDLIQDWGTYTLKNSLGINFCGTMTTISNGSNEVATVVENTNYNNFGETYCESTCFDGIHPAFRDNLIVKPADVNNRGIRGDDGVHAATGFLRQTNFSLDYNGFYQMPGSGDPGAEPPPAGVPALLPNPALGGIVSYVNITGAIVGGLQSKVITSVTDPTHVGCASCNFVQSGAAGVMPGDYFENNSLRKVVTVASVTDATHLVLTSPGLSGMRQGTDTLTLTASYWNHPGWFFGDSHNGSHDIHANPIFVDPTRTLCTWYRMNSGTSLSCPTYGSIMNGNITLVATNGTGGTTIVCSACNFTANGITTADLVRVFAGTGQTVRGWAGISSVTSTTLALTSTIPGLMKNDAFDFITATQGIGRALVQSAGFDWNGNQVAPLSWATVPTAMHYVYGGFAPQNFIYKGAGSPADGFPDIGAVPVTGSHFEE
jgi:hypothetical protein